MESQWKRTAPHAPPTALGLPERSDCGTCPPCPDPTCRDRVFRWMSRMAGNLDDAEDLRQEVCHRCLQTRVTFLGEARFSTWLYRLAVNAFHDFLRKKRSTPAPAQTGYETARLAQALEGWPTMEGPDWGMQVVRESVRMALAQLTPRQRQLLEWKYFDGLSHAEIGRNLGIREQSTRLAVQRARTAFKRAYVPPKEEGDWKAANSECIPRHVRSKQAARENVFAAKKLLQSESTVCHDNPSNASERGLKLSDPAPARVYRSTAPVEYPACGTALCVPGTSARLASVGSIEL
jgi:RNA polymerase sigma-70 factor, ECF subfamily